MSKHRLRRHHLLVPLLAATAVAVPSTGAAAAGTSTGSEGDDLQRALAAVHDGGMYGIAADLRSAGKEWRAAAGVADVRTARPVTRATRFRIGSITKTFTAVAVLQQVDRGRVRLDAPIADYLPGLIPGERGRQITVRMLMDHTSGIGDYLPAAFPSLAAVPPTSASLDANRHRSVSPQTLIRLGLAQPATGAPGAGFSYSNTNYIVLGELLKAVTHTDPAAYINKRVIARAGLHDTVFPATAALPHPVARGYESLFGAVEPPRDYTVYDPSWSWTAGSMFSTPSDLDRFYRELLAGRLMSPASLTQMKTTVPIKDGQGNVVGQYGLGLSLARTPCGDYWGHSGAIWGYSAVSLIRADGRQFSAAWNLSDYQRLDANGRPLPNAIDPALSKMALLGICGTTPVPSPTTMRSLTLTS